MKSGKLIISLSILLAIMLQGIAINAQSQEQKITIGYIKPGRIDVKAFVLLKETTIMAEGYGGLFKKLGNDLMFYGWILDSKSRKVVWNLLEDANDKFFERSDPGRFGFKKEVKLPAGQYEVYYAAGMNYNRFGSNNVDIRISDLGDLFNLIFSEINDNNDNYNSSYASKFSMSITASSAVFSEVAWDKKVNEFSSNALISIVRAGDDLSVKKSFTVANDINLNIMEIGEQSDGDLNDFAWIVNANTYEKIWPNSETRFKKAGGGSKNKSTFQTIRLPKGTYTLHYISDDSHSYDKWNVLPPYDPQFWGITVWPDEADKSKVKTIEQEDPFVLKLNKAKNNAYLSQGFTLKKDMKIRVLSQGESSGDFDMADYGWIVNTDTHTTVWEFTQRKGQYAGGGEKNKIVNQEIDLPKGNYVAYFVTDDSHAYGDWNVAPPLVPELWGISILVNSDKDSFVLTDAQSASSNSQILAEIVRVRDDERIRKSFSLDKETKVRIFAIGEGDDGDLVDLGWIKNSNTDKIVWEMTYRTSERAGGADKNRLYDGTIVLPAGDYTVYYETDGSHSYRDWNDTPPYDQEHYGITVYRIQ
ncbi:MAG: hypothetical protein EHM93_17665 [Bacteroidales bacterium]|nr:MAG: hypothetical protein EHM93_17665 [Bacteroidales bacterium]